jgi:hypothetical protein
MIKKIECVEEYYLKFTDEEFHELGWKNNQKFSIDLNPDNSISLKPFSSIEIDLSEFKRDTLEFLISLSVEKDISVNDVISEILEDVLKNEK